MDLKKLDLCIRSRFPLVVIVSYEEDRIITDIQALCEDRKNTLYLSPIYTGRGMRYRHRWCRTYHRHPSAAISAAAVTDILPLPIGPLCTIQS